MTSTPEHSVHGSHDPTHVPSPALSTPHSSSPPSSPTKTPLWLARDVKILKQQGCHILVSCCEDHELKEMGIHHCLAAELRVNYVQFIRFPIQKWVPRISLDDFVSLTANLASLIANEEKVVVIQSDSGKGRSALVAAGVLIQMGYTHKEAIDVLVATDNQCLQNPLFYGYLSVFNARIAWERNSQISDNMSTPPPTIVHPRRKNSSTYHVISTNSVGIEDGVTEACLL